MNLAQPIEDLVINHFARSCRPARHNDNVRRRRIGKCMRDAKKQSVALGDDRSGFFADKSYLGIGHARQDFPWAYGVQRCHPRVEKNCDLQRLFVLHLLPAPAHLKNPRHFFWMRRVVSVSPEPAGQTGGFTQDPVFFPTVNGSPMSQHHVPSGWRRATSIAY